jgi:hypothetical protein
VQRRQGVYGQHRAQHSRVHGIGFQQLSAQQQQSEEGQSIRTAAEQSEEGQSIRTASGYSS